MCLTRYTDGTPRILTSDGTNFRLREIRELATLCPVALVYFPEAGLEQSAQAVVRNANVLNAVLNRGDLVSCAPSHDPSRVWVLSALAFPRSAGQHVNKGKYTDLLFLIEGIVCGCE